jgi:hypothetical protein
MLNKILLAVAIIGALGAGAFNFFVVKDKIAEVQKARDDYHTDRDKEANEHKKFQKLAKDTQSKLDETNRVLVATMTERDAAVAKADEQTKLAAELQDTLKKTTGERDAAQNDLAAWNALNVPIEKIKATLASLKDVSEDRDRIADENKVLLKANQKLQDKLDFILNPEHEVLMQAGLKGHVLVTDPRYDFVVLDIGEKQGVKEYGKLIVNRNGKLIAKVQVKSVQQDRSIANVMPGWKLGDVMEGDQVLY